MTQTDPEPHAASLTLSESYVQDAFHSYLKSSLAQAKAERLLDAEVLSSAEGDLMITGPALCLYFAALRCTTYPPSVPLPRQSKGSGAPMDLSTTNCPPAFASFLHVWSLTVPKIQNLIPEHQHDLARIICGLPPLSIPSPTGSTYTQRGSRGDLGGDQAQPHLVVHGLAADLRAVAIEISQRRSFQDRYASDLQAALDSGVSTPASPGGGLGYKKATFVPPPSYEPSPTSSPNASPRSSMEDVGGREQYATYNLPPQSPTHLSPLPNPHSSTPTRASGSSPSHSRPPSPMAFDPLSLIRETLYASLADVLSTSPSLTRLLHTDPPRAYFASVAFAILDVARTRILPDGSVRGVLGKELTLAECPPPLRPFMHELGEIGRQGKQFEEEDDERAVRYVSEGRDVPESRMDRVRTILEEGVGYSYARGGRVSPGADGRRSVEGRAVAFANRINALALGMTRLPAFRERQDEVFKVLGGVGVSTGGGGASGRVRGRGR